eukprot:8491789-Heterocapsa_arctica.AAC.1
MADVVARFPHLCDICHISYDLRLQGFRIYGFSNVLELWALGFYGVGLLSSEFVRNDLRFVRNSIVITMCVRDAERAAVG